MSHYPAATRLASRLWATLSEFKHGSKVPGTLGSHMCLPAWALQPPPAIRWPGATVVPFAQRWHG